MALYSELTDDQLARVLELYGLEFSAASHLASGVANTSYRAECTTTTVVVTVLDNKINLPATTLVSLLKYLSENGIATAAPLRSRAGAFVEEIDDRRVMLKPFIEGSCYDRLPEKHLFTAGEALASVNLLAAPTWLPNGSRRLNDLSSRLERFEDQAFSRWVADRVDETGGLFGLGGPSGVVHGDYFSDNIIIDLAGHVSILDWETASNDLVLLDLGFAIVGLASSNGAFEPGRARLLLDGYQRRRRLTADERPRLLDTVIYAATVLGFHRYLRHHIRYPDPAKQHLYEEMPELVNDVRRHWPQTDSASGS